MLSSMPERAVTLTVFMEGTSNPMDVITTQIALFSRLVDATPLPEELPTGISEIPAKSGHYKLCFSGCGVSHGFVGVIFAAGLREQCRVVRQHLEAFLAAGLSITLNFVGLSRGGIGGAYLAQSLADLDKSQVILNLLLFDPVPGNFVWISRFLDPAGVSNANQAMDVSSVGNLGRVLVLYPYVSLPALAVHAPLLIRFPMDCDLEEEVILGCHQGALFLRPAADTCLSFARIRDFLVGVGSKLGARSQVSSRVQHIAQQLDVPDEQLADMLAQELRINAPSSRFAHCIDGRQIVRLPSGHLLNRSHEALLRRLGRASEPPASSDVPRYMLDLA